MAEASSSTRGDDAVYSTTSSINFFGERRSILLHNGNGVQSLLSICNAIILREKLVLDSDLTNESELILFLKDKLKELCPQTMKDSLDHAVSTTQDLSKYNPKPVWDGIGSFRENTCSSIFDVLQIALVHGWIITDDKNVEPKSYDEIEVPGSSDLENAMASGDVTLDGFSTLKEKIGEHQICVVVHKNQLHTAMKHEEELYLLIMEKELNSMGKVWKKLMNGSMVGDDLKEEVREGIALDAIGEASIYCTSMEFNFLGEYRTILLHNGDGLDSLISICNALILRENIILEDQFTDEWELVRFLNEKIQELCPETMKNSLPDAISRAQDLRDYRPKPLCNRIDSFGDNSCSLIFDVLQIPLFHGWIETDKNVELKCCNEINASGSPDLETIMLNKDGDFTDYGLYSLKEKIGNHQICVLVNSNKFHTAIKHNDELYLLIVDKYIQSSAKVWEKVYGGIVGEDFIQSSQSDLYEERYDTGVGLTEEATEEHYGYEGSMEGSYSQYEDDVGDDSGDSMETHVGGRNSPTSVLDCGSSDSTSDSTSD